MPDRKIAQHLPVAGAARRAGLTPARRRAGLLGWLGAAFVAVGAFASLAVLLVVLPTLESSIRSDRLNRRSAEVLNELTAASRRTDFQVGYFDDGVRDALQRLAIELGGEVRLITQGGQVAAAAGPGQTYLPITPGGEAEVALRGGRARRVVRVGSVPVVFAAAPVVAQGSPVGALEAAVPVDGQSPEVAVVRQRVFIAVAAVLGLAILGGFLLARALTRRIDGLADTAGALAGGNLSARAEPTSPRELASLGESLNTMAERLGGLVATSLGERDRARGLIGSLSEGVLAVTPKGEVILANDAARRHLDLPDSQEELRIDALPRTVAAAARRVLIGAARHADEEVVMPSGMVLDLHAQPILQRAGGVVVTLRDVTDERRLDQARRDLVANVSHELKTPLAAIRGFLELLEDGVDESRRREFLALMSTEAERLERLVEEQLELARLDAGGVRLEREQIDLGELAGRVAASRQALAAREGVALRAIPPRGPAIADADPARVEQILLILLDNALRYTPRDGQVSVDSGVESGKEGGVWTRVADTGPGIPPEVQPFVFDRYYQADPAREGRGAGLGLAIARGLARAHGGSIELASTPGQGTAFTVHLPGPSRVPITEGGERPALVGAPAPHSAARAPS